MTKKLMMPRREVLTGGLALAASAVLAAPALAQAARPEVAGDESGLQAKRNISSFKMHRWQDHFESLKNGVILADTQSRMLQYWSEDESIYKLYPTSVPLTEDLTRRGYTEVIRKVEGPTWAPTPSMIERDPSLPRFVGAGPENPLGTHALYLSWQYYRVHGTNDTRKIGRRSSSGCVGLYNEQIAELFALAKVGTQVKLL